jgi:peptide/nickel transport system substrate-binding protein
MARTTSIALRAGMWCVAVLACATSALWAASACRTTTPVSSRPAPVRLAIGYAGPAGQTGMGAMAIGGYLISSERLVQLRRDGRIEPSLAERWEQSTDGLTWRFVLKPNLTFHNGKPLDADAIVGHLRGCRQIGCRDIASVESEDPRTVVVRMRRPSSLLLDSLSVLGIYSGKANEASAGPFRAAPTKDKRPSVFSFEAFPQYHRGYPTVDQLELKIFPSARNAWAAMMRGEIDMLYEVAPDALDFIEQSSNTQVRSFLRPFVFTMALNVKHPALGERDVRRALNMAVNRTEIIQRVFRGHAFPATDHVWPRHWAYDHEMPRLRYDPAKATELLEAKGLRIPPPGGANTAARTETPSRFHFTCMIPEGHAVIERVGLLLQRQLTEVGVDMRIEVVTVADINRRLPTGQFDAFILDLISSPGLDRAYQWWHSPDGPVELADTGYTAADGALDRIREARTEEETRQAVRSVQQVMRDDPPAVFLLWPETARAISARFRVPLTPDRDVIYTLPRWTLAAPPDLPGASPVAAAPAPPAPAAPPPSSP